MFFSIDPHNGVPIYEQIVRQVKFAIAEGTLIPGQLLPSVRALSQRLAINPNTIARAFQQLQTDGSIESLRGRGLVVTNQAVESCRNARKLILEERIRSVLAEALHGGLSSKDIRKIVTQQLEQLDGAVATVSSSLDSDFSETVES